MVNQKLIGEYLVEQRFITPQQLQAALEEQTREIEGGRMPLLGTVLVTFFDLKEVDLSFALDQQERDRMRLG